MVASNREIRPTVVAACQFPLNENTCRYKSWTHLKVPFAATSLAVQKQLRFNTRRGVLSVAARSSAQVCHKVFRPNCAAEGFLPVAGNHCTARRRTPTLLFQSEFNFQRRKQRVGMSAEIQSVGKSHSAVCITACRELFRCLHRSYFLWT